MSRYFSTARLFAVRACWFGATTAGPVITIKLHTATDTAESLDMELDGDENCVDARIKDVL